MRDGPNMRGWRDLSTWNARLGQRWANVDPSFLPFADAATEELPMSRLLRLSLFQVTVAMAIVLLNGTLNRVMIVELGVSSAVVAAMISLPLLFAPFRALIGYHSDSHRSVLGWRRVPYIWFGTLLQFGGFAIMPFALLLLSGDTTGPMWIGQAAAALAFVLVGAGLHTTQTAGLALAMDLAPEKSRPRVIALLYVVLLLGMVVSSLAFGGLLAKFSQLRLIQVVQGVASVTMILNVVALWKQEPRDRALADRPPPAFNFREAWAQYCQHPDAVRALIAVGLGTAAFSMQDILLEPYGGEILRMSVGETTVLTSLVAAGMLAGFALAAGNLSKGGDPYRLAGYGALAGVAAFPAIIFSASAEFGSPLPGRRRPHRLRQRAVRRQHHDSRHVDHRQRATRSCTRCLGRGASNGHRHRYRAERRNPRRRFISGCKRLTRKRLERAGDWLQRRLQSRNPTAVSHAHRHWSAGAENGGGHGQP